MVEAPVRGSADTSDVPAIGLAPEPDPPALPAAVFAAPAFVIVMLALTTRVDPFAAVPVSVSA